MTPARAFAVVAACAALVGCGNRDDAHPAPGQGAQAAAPSRPATTPAAPVVDEACAQIIVVAWQGADRAPATVTRDESAARAKIEEIRARLDHGEEFSAVARAESDAPVTAARGGVVGTFTREAWPERFRGIRDPVFALGVSQISDVLRLPFGWAIARRCPVQKIHTRHILIRFVGATNAPATVTRTREQAREAASALRDRIVGRGEDFATLAGDQSEDASAARGGDVGLVARGLFAPAYEEAAWALPTLGVSEVVETEYGFHLIQRLP